MRMKQLTDNATAGKKSLISLVFFAEDGWMDGWIGVKSSFGPRVEWITLPANYFCAKSAI